ncbi:glycosyltransferase family 4 protein [Sphingomonas solaris]|uniref:Glycosyltransferase family 4 protein n=1 Tax=Alterirhizorhabdus solaris TaxID=2529389 RepID=A0A558R1X0_9SPHN|nr:glycosyltransferase family 1 protein [Sphingomonas solaris]TVV73374.1 glycosyltransferase family 4 protein [Sphingomonas solaris]
MRIGVDGYNMAMPTGTGVATYGVGLVQTLRSMGHRVEGVFGIDVGDDPRLREVLFFDNFARDEKDRRKRRKWDRRARAAIDVVRGWAGADAQEVTLSGHVETAAFAGRLPVFDRLVSSADLFERAHRHFSLFGRFLTLTMPDPPEIMHWTYPVPIRLKGAKNIYTLHDLVPLRLPYTTLDVKKTYHRMIEHCVREADHICTDSEASRNDILAMFDARPDRVTNTYLVPPSSGSALAADPADDAAIIAGTFGLAPQSYFLYFGAVEPRKNIGRLIEAYLSLNSQSSFVIVGAKAWSSDGDLKLLNSGAYGPAADRILRLSYLPRETLLRLIRGARAVVFPSLYEGFGLPVLEAMQLGTPVLTSDISSMPEVAGDAAMLVDPYAMKSIVAGLRALDDDAALRARLGAAGPAQAAKFSQARFADTLAGIYARLG